MYSTKIGLQYITLLLLFVHSSAHLTVLFIVLPHTHSKANGVEWLGRRQVAPLSERKKIASHSKIVQGHSKLSRACVSCHYMQCRPKCLCFVLLTIYTALSTGVTLKCRLCAVQGHWKWRKSIDHIRLTITSLQIPTPIPSPGIEKQEVKVIWQKAPHGGPIPRLGVTPGGRNLYHWITGVGFPISVP